MSSELEAGLTQLLNSHSAENESGTPDFILARFLMHVLRAYNSALLDRAKWRGESTELPALARQEAAIDDRRTIPWPPSDELVERCVWAVRRMVIQDDERPSEAAARAVLDAIGGAGDE